MIDQWFKQDIEHQLSHGNRAVVLDPDGQCGFLLSLLSTLPYTVITTDPALTEQWQTVKEELFLRHKAETEFKDSQVVFYVTREKSKLSFLFDYCATHGCLDLSKPTEWLRQKLFANTGLQIQMDSPLLLTAAKLGIGKDIAWWKKILQNLEEMLRIEDELLPFIDSPAAYLNGKDPDIRRLFEEKLFDIIGQPFMAKPPETVAQEVVDRLLDGLLYNDVPEMLLKVYYRWADSDRYRPSLLHYISTYKISHSANPWAAHPDHCFDALDKLALRQLAENLRDKQFRAEKLSKIAGRASRNKVTSFVPSWWQDILSLLEFDNSGLAPCNDIAKTVDYYTAEFSKVDRAIRHLYEAFLQDEEIIRPLQEYYETLNHTLLGHWFLHSANYTPNQRGYLSGVIKKGKPGIAVIVGDGIRYEIADAIAAALGKKASIDKQTMLAELPSETEHNMSVLYSAKGEIVPLQKTREELLSGETGKEITFINLEELNQGTKGDFLILTYKDIDSTGEKLQQGALKLFAEFEQVLIDKILLLLNMGFIEVRLVTDHGFVLTGLLDESDKIDPAVSGKKQVHERYIRCENKQNNPDWIELKEKYGEFNYVYTAKSHRPFKSKGVYGFSHGGFTPQEVILPAFVFRKSKTSRVVLEIAIVNKPALEAVTGENFSIKLQAAATAPDLFSTSRKVCLSLFAGSSNYFSSNVVTMEPGDTTALEFSFCGNTTVKAVLLDAETQEQIDTVTIDTSNLRDTGGLL